MIERLKKISKMSGLAPGTLIHIGEKKIEKVRIRVIDYDENDFEEKELTSIEEIFPYKDKTTVTWLNIDGLHDVDIIQKIGEKFGFHPLVMEDVINTGQRPKTEEYDDYIFGTLKMLFHIDGESRIMHEQFSLILCENFVVTFQEKVGDVFEPIRERLRKGKGRIRRNGADYLAYALMDAVVDNYFIVLEKMGEDIESLEEELLSDPSRETLGEIHALKRELISLRKFVWPLREVIRAIETSESDIMNEKTLVYLRDVYDHVIQVNDSIETSRELVSGMLDVYLSSISNKMNEVMKVLTVVATIFIPLTFIAGIYGMNFKYMPELEWHWGYPVAIFVMFIVVAVMVLWFRRKHFL
ncbi:magnesium/cobalt transporter CorA [Thermodesulfobacteriota bacterium]